MQFLNLLAYWYLFSKFYILGSIFVTHLLNRSTKKLWLSPLIVNAVSVVLLIIGIVIKMIQSNEVFDAVIRIYLPVVFTSIVMNIIIKLIQIVKEKINGKF